MKEKGLLAIISSNFIILFMLFQPFSLVLPFAEDGFFGSWEIILNFA